MKRALLIELSDPRFAGAGAHLKSILYILVSGISRKSTCTCVRTLKCIVIPLNVLSR